MCRRTVKSDVDIFRRDHFERNEVFIFVQYQVLDSGTLSGFVNVFVVIFAILAPLFVETFEMCFGLPTSLLVLLLIGVGEVAEDRIEEVSRDVEASSHLKEHVSKLT